VIVNGRVDQVGDWDVFRFEGRAGDEIVAEVCARRLQSPLDSVLILTDAKGSRLADNDDYDDPGAGLIMHQADSWIRSTLPADGTYYLRVADAQGRGGGEYGYRLRVSPPRPDFELRVAPSGINVRPGLTVPVTVYALRRDGFSDDIELELKGAPPGFTLSGARIPAGRDRVRITLTAPPPPIAGLFQLRLEGRATIQGKEVRRAGEPADEMIQAFANLHLVPAEEWLAAVTGRGSPRTVFRLLGDQHVRLPAGGSARVRIAAPARQLAGQLRFTLSEPPDGITIGDVSYERGAVVIVLHAEAGRAEPGLRDNLIVDAFAERTVVSPVGQQQAEKRRIPLGTLPAISFEIPK